ncbi:glycosyltransferase [Geobacter hydrogenophilus]|uniref:glycosyltransferase family 2 protein n=1 Tax=Geobacter hydrogenophilus TaxID=40983 RepID=UPI001BD92380|nr:glycosyltransferase family 2 protein [Geobacter hydrogenophilus]MBT0895213.1 glycosyltransferase [Geobacter hydrogenophilus]
MTEESFLSNAAKPLITVITVVRNGAAELEETIRSIIAQNYDRLEYRIVDGGSTDGSVEIIKKYENYLKSWSSEPDYGIYDAMNRGWKLADENSYILFLGAGDLLLSLPKTLSEPSCGEVVCGTVGLSGNRKFFPSADWRLRIYNSLHHQALLVPKMLHPLPPFDLSLPRYADFDFNQRLMKLGVRFRYAPEFQSAALPGGVSDHPNFKESVAVVRKNFGLLWWGLALLGYGAVRCLPLLKLFTSIRKE